MILILAALTRFSGLTTHSMWTDELLRTAWARGVEIGPVVDAPPASLGRHAHANGMRASLEVINRHTTPLQSLFINRYLRWFAPEDDASWRVPFVLFGLLAVLGTLLLGWELCGRTVGLIAGTLAALSPYQVHYSQEFNHYAIALCFSAFSGLFFVRFLKRGTWRDGVLWAVASVLGLYTHYYVALVLVAQGLAILPWLRTTPREALKRLTPFGLMALGFGPYVPVVIKQATELTSNAVSGQFGGMPYFIARLGDALTVPWAGVASSQLPAGLAAALGLAFLALIALGLRAEPDTRTRWLLGAGVLVPWALLFTAYWVRENNTHLWARYAIFMHSTIYVAAALAVTRLERVQRVVLVAVPVVAMAVGLFYFFNRYRKEEWREVAELINTSATAGEAIVLEPNMLTPVLAHYLTGETPVSSMGEPHEAQWMAERMWARQGVFSVRAWGKDEVSDLLDALLACRFLERDTTHFFGLRVTHFFRPLPKGQPSPCPASSPVTFETGSCTLEGETGAVTATGWVEAPEGPWQLEFADGLSREMLGTAALEPAGDGASRRTYRAQLTLSGVSMGALRPVTMRLVAPGLPPKPLARQVLCIRRPAMTVTPGPLVERSRLEAVVATPQGQPALVEGWVYSSAGVAELIIFIDGVEVKRTRSFGFARADVTTFFPEVSPSLTMYSGFSDTIDTSDLKPGKHQVSAQVVHLDGTTRAIERDAVLRVLKDESASLRTAERGFLERVEVNTPGKLVTLHGWAFSTLGIDAVRISVDDVERIRRRPSRIERPDVAKNYADVHPDVTLRAGFAEQFDISALDSGHHTVRLDMVHPDGTLSPITNALDFTR
ncbi:MAG: glycosyltransferase family 39 protein [Archangium sp.]|nr:glycosyltransferase family 39 protein [Archangium sp.]